VVELVLPEASALSLGRLRARLTRELLAVDADAAERRREKAEREADEEKMRADRQRRESALNGRPEPAPSRPPELAHLGKAQRDLALVLLRHPIPYPKDASRFALRRLRQRGLVEPVPGEETWQATARLREIAGWL